ncbi:MAG TPA: mechanosensitive ion channel, partial [Saprospiraceae bacterium]|nr:mechanosensitive ion channel [Saprospiraceae bacterium]
MSQYLKLALYISLITLFVFLRRNIDAFPDYVNQQVLVSIFSLAIVLLFFRVVLSIFKIIYKIKYKSSYNPTKDNVIVGLNNLFTVLSVIAVFITFFGMLGIDIKTLFTSLSIVAAAIAIITKDLISEVIIGVINSFSTKIELDDYVKIGDQKGKLVDIGLQKITLLNDDDDLVYIPNTKFYNVELINYTKRDFRRMSVDFEIAIQYVDDLNELEHEIVSGLSEFQDFIEPNSYAIKIVECTKDHLSLKFQYTL